MLKAIYISYDGILEPLGQSQILPYIKELSKKKINFYLVSFEKKKYYNEISYKDCFRNLSQCNIRWRPLIYHKKPQILSTIFDIFNGLFICSFIIIKYKPKIIHARSYVAALMAWLIKKIFHTKFIFDMRGFWADERVEGRIWKTKNGLLYKFAKFIEVFLLRDADEIIVLTHHAVTILKNWGYTTRNVSVIPCCVDDEFFKFDRETRVSLRSKYGLSDKLIFVHTGALGYWYMKDKMIDYFKSAINILPNVHFLILTQDEYNKIIKIISDAKLDREYFTILNISFNEMPKYLSMADAGIFFITPVFSKLASSPTKFAEYLSCGLPVITNERIGDLEEYITNNNIGVIIRNFCREEYNESLERLAGLLRDDNLKSRCRRTVYDNFSLKIGVGKYSQIYSRLN
jgi:glycosyltransferase involved in cell wall biosynthesis